MGQNLLDEQLERIAPTAGATDPLTRALQEAHQDRTGAGTVALRVNMGEAKKTTPDRAAEVKRISDRTGIPPLTVDRNFDQIKKQADADDTPYAKMLRETPVLAAQLSEKPEVSKIAQDDLEQLGVLEWLFTAPQRAFAQSTAQMRAANLRTASLFRDLTREETDQLNAEKFYAEYGGNLGAGDSWFKGAVTGGSQLLANVLFGGLRAGRGAALGAGAGAVIGGAGGALAGGVGAVPGAVQGAAFGARAGAVIEGGRFGFELEAGLAFDEFLEFKDDQGRTIDPDAARAAAFAAGAVNAGLEVVGLGILAKTIPGIDRLKGLAGREAIKTALKSPTVRAALGQAVKGYGKTLTAETAVEVAQRAVTILAGEAGKLATPGERPAGRTAQDILEDLGREGVGALQGFAFIAAPGHVMTAASDSQKARQAKENERWFKAAGEGTLASKTFERAPDVVQELLQRAVEKGPIPTVYAPTETWRAYWQAKGDDPAARAAEVTGKKNALEDAEQSGTDLPIPTERYAVKIAATEHNEYFSRELRLDPDEWNVREAEAWAEQQAAEEARPADDATMAGAAAVEQQLAQQLVQGGRFDEATARKVAKLGTAGIAQMAEDAGVDPFDVFGQYGLRVQRPDLPQQPKTEAAPAPARAAAPAPAAGQVQQGRLDNIADETLTGEAATEKDKLAAEAARVQAPIVMAISGGLGERPDLDAERDALAREARGGDVVVYDRAGNRRTGMTADYSPLRGEVIGIEGPKGFRVIEDRGGRIPSYTSESQVTDATDTAADRGTPGDGGDAGDGVSESRPGVTENDVARILRKRTGESTRDLERRRTEHVQTARQQRREAHFDAVFDHVLQAAQQLDPQVNAEMLEREFDFRVDLWEQKVSDYFSSGSDPLDLLRDIARLGGIGAESVGGLSGERRLLMENTVAGRYKQIQVFRKKKLDDRGQIAEGKPFDVMLQHLQQGGRYQYLETTSDLIEAIDDAFRYESLYEEGVYPGTDELKAQLGIDPKIVWWTDAWSPEAQQLQERDALEAEGGDDSFDVSEFGQSLIDLMNEGEADQEATPATEDTLDTGEVQPRLPGAEAVREQDVATPQLEAPFSLTSEVSRAKKGKQQTFFQAAYHGTPHAFEEFSLQHIGSGEGAQSYGWGLYFAGRREVAEYYRQQLAGVALPVFKSLTDEENKLIPDWVKERIANAVEHPIVPEIGSRDAGTREVLSALEGFRKQVADDEHSLKIVTEEEAAAAKADGWGNLLEAGKPRHHQPWNIEARLPNLRRIVATLEKLATDPELEFHREKPGRLFTVEIPEDDVMIHWDRPASQQPAKVQAALRELGLHWETFKPKTLGQLRAWFNSDSAQLLAAEDIGIREALREGWFHVQALDERAAREWQEQHQGFFSSGMVDPSGERLYDDVKFQAQQAHRRDPANLKDTGSIKIYTPMNLSQAAEAASRMLAEKGVVGIKYLDGGSRSNGNGSHNYVIFDDRLIRVVTYEQRKPINKGLIVAHNLTAANLRHAARMGGLPVPSLAITASNQAITGFGEITLIGDAAMADPQGYAKTQVFGGDAYSPRYPTIHYTLDAKAEKELYRLLKENPEGGESYIDTDSLEKEGVRDFRRRGFVMAKFLKEKGFTLPAPVIDKPRTTKGGVTIAGGLNPGATRFNLEEIIRKGELQEELDDYADKLFATLSPTEKIFRGFTNQGNRSYRAHTLENVVSILKKELRGGETSGNLYGIGQLRSKFAPKFRSVAAIKKAAGRLVSREDFEKIKAEVETDFFQLGEDLRPYYTHQADPFRYTDTVLAVLEDAGRQGLPKTYKDYGFEDVPASVSQSIVEFLEHLRHLPTEYFEAKILREVDLAEFAGAVVPTNTDAETLELLKRRGVEVAFYDRAAGETARRAVVEQLADTLGQRVLFQDPKDKRGAITIGPGRQMTINLFERADLSTFLHETGHFFLEVFGDLAERVSRIPEAERTAGQKRLLGNWAQALEQLGVTSRDQIEEQQHELFARQFEAYLYEGRAPSMELREIFASFRAWLLAIYRSLKDLNAPLTDDVRRVFDRMLANDEAIVTAEERGRLAPLFLTAEAAGMTPAQFALYREAIQKASMTAREDLDRRHLKEVRREQEDLYKARREEVRAEVEQQAAGAPVYRALAAIRHGENPDGTPLVEGLITEPLKLSKDLIVQRYGADRLKRLPRPVIYAKEGGLDPDFVAERFGFSSGDEMLGAFETTEPMRQAIERETTDRMNREHGGLLLDGTIFEAARGAVANEDRDVIIRAELRALAKLRNQVDPFVRQAKKEGDEQLAGERRERDYERRWKEAEHRLEMAIQQGENEEALEDLRVEIRALKAKARGGPAVIRAALPPAELLRDQATERIAGTRIVDIKPALYWNAARNASQAATEAAARQDFDEAIRQKTKELSALAHFRAAQAALEDSETRATEIRALSKPAAQRRLGLAGSTYLEQILGIISRFDFAKVPEKELRKRARFLHWIEGLEATGNPFEAADFPPEIVQDAFGVNYRELTYESLVGVSDGVKMIIHMANLKTRLLKHQAAREFADVEAQLETSIRDNKKTGKLPIEFRPKDQRKIDVRSWFAQHTKIATLARILDGGKDGGAFWEFFQRPLNAARDWEVARKQTEGKGLAAVVEKHYPGRQISRLNETKFIPAIGESLSLEGRLALALNWGNETSRDRVLADPRRKWNRFQVEAILETLDDNDLAFVEDVWAFIDRFWPEIKDKQERVYGIAPEKVQASKFTVGGRELAGGYYPLKYDTRISWRAGQHAKADEAKSAMAGAYVRTTTRRGHVEQRKRNVKDSIRLDLSVAFSHVEQVIHDLAYHEALIDANRIVRSKNVSTAIIDTHGAHVLEEFSTALQDIAVGNVPAKGIWERAAKWARTGTQLSLLGFNLWTAAQQPLGLFNGASRVGSKYVARGMARWLYDAATMQSTTQWIASVSPFMANRVSTATQDIAELKAALQKPGGWFDRLVRTVSLDTVTQQTILDSYLWHISVMQRVADVPTWLGAYEKAQEQGNDNARSVALADQAVLDSQGGGSIQDLSRVQRGGEMAKLYMAFFSYGSTLFNSTRDVLARTDLKKPSEVGSMLADLSLLYVMPAVGTVIMANLFGKDDDDDAKDFIDSVGGEVLASALNTMIFVREFAGLDRGNRGYSGPSGARIFDLIFKLKQQADQGELDEALGKATLNAAGVIFRFPAAQVQRTIDGYVALEEGKTKNPAALFFGAPRKDR